MKNQILMVGDSWTAGTRIQALGFNTWPMWPELIAKKLNMTFKNYADGGRGNEFIYNQVIDNYDGEELIIVLWSHYDRWDFAHYSLSCNPYRGKDAYDGDDPTSREKKEKIFDVLMETELLNAKYNFNKSIRWIHAFQNFCEANKIKYMQAQAFHPAWELDQWNGINHFVDSPLLYYIDETHFLGWPLFKQIGGFTMSDKLDEVDPDQSKLRVNFMYDPHPNEEGHKYITELFYKFYRGLYD